MFFRHTNSVDTWWDIFVAATSHPPPFFFFCLSLVSVNCVHECISPPGTLLCRIDFYFILFIYFLFFWGAAQKNMPDSATPNPSWASFAALTIKKKKIRREATAPPPPPPPIFFFFPVHLWGWSSLPLKWYLVIMRTLGPWKLPCYKSVLLVVTSHYVTVVFKSWNILLVSHNIPRTKICRILPSVRRELRNMIEGDRAASRPLCQSVTC